VAYVRQFSKITDKIQHWLWYSEARMTEQAEQLKHLIESSRQILITSHISPDPDAIASTLLLGTTLAANYPDKQIAMALEEEPEGLDFLSGYERIQFGPLVDSLEKFSPDLFFLLDGVNFDRVSRHGGQKVRDYIKQNAVRTVTVDHHQPTGKDEVDIYINQGNVSTTQDVYEICFDQLHLQKPPDYGETTMVGIYSDSGGFVYINNRHQQMFKIVSDLLDEGVSLETVRNRLNRYSQDHLQAMAAFMANLKSEQDYNYSYLSDEFAQAWSKANKSPVTMHTGAAFFVDQYIRNSGGKSWGFIVYPNLILGEGYYSVSLRAPSDGLDVAKIANRLGGGGHKPAAGAKIEATSVDEAIQKVQQVIGESRD